MRLSAALAPLAFVAVGCGGSPTDPFHRPSGPVPAGLAVALRGTPAYGDSLPGGPTIAAAGDSVTAAAVVSTSGCSNYSARAGVEGGVLVVTVVDSLTDRICNLGMQATVFRAVVRPAPSGRYDAVLRTRVVPPRQAPLERVLVRQSVVVR